MALSMRQDVREYLRASAKLFGLAFQDNAVTEIEREAICRMPNYSHSGLHGCVIMINLP